MGTYAGNYSSIAHGDREVILKLTQAKFTRSMRMTTPLEFKDALKTKPVGQGKLLLLHHCPPRTDTTEGIAQAKLGMIVPKRFLRLSVNRHRVKRVLRESFRHMQSKLPAGSYLFRLKFLPKALPNSQLKQLTRQEADKLLSKLLGAR